MIRMKNFFGQDIFRVVFILVIAAFLGVANTGCDLLDDDDDDNSSAGGAATAPAPAPAPPSVPTPTPAAAPIQEAPASDSPSLSGTGIVWKPVSEGDHKLVVLIPRNYGHVGVAVLSPDGKLIEEGRYVGRTNGNRPTYRFSRQGRGYPNGSLLRVGSKTFLVERTANRYN